MKITCFDRFPDKRFLCTSIDGTGLSGNLKDIECVFKGLVQTDISSCSYDSFDLYLLQASCKKQCNPS